MSVISVDEKSQAITANLKALRALLVTAARQSAEACVFKHNGEDDGAIGTVLGLDTILDDAKALYSAVIVLHRLKAN